MSRDERMETLHRGFLVTLYVLLFAASLSNLLLLWLIPRRAHLRTLSNIQIFNICLADFMYSLAMPFIVVIQLRGEWIFGKGLCHLVYSLEAVAKQGVVGFVTLAAVERYLAVCRPLFRRRWWTMRNAGVVSVAMWVAAAALMTPVLFSIQAGTDSVAELHLRINDSHAIFDNYTFRYCATIWAGDDHLTGAVSLLKRGFVIYSTGVYIICTIIIAGCYIGIVRKVSLSSKRLLRHHKSTMSSTAPTLHSSSEDKEQRIALTTHKPQRSCSEMRPGESVRGRAYRKVTKMVLILVAFYLACWTPFWVQNLLATFRLLPSQYADKTLFRVAQNLIHMLPYLNCTLNPLLYAFLTDNFKEAICRSRAEGPNESRSRIRGLTPLQSSVSMNAYGTETTNTVTNVSSVRTKACRPRT